jgi:hypothetical protein
MRSHLLEGKVRHRRARPFVYELEHDVFYAALDLSELDELDRKLKLVGRNRRAVLGFRDADHLLTPAVDLPAAIQAHLRAEGVDPEGWQVTLITNLRIFGYVFNPASFFLCRDEKRELRVVIVEVHNTHGERHLYTLRPKERGERFSASMAKDFYVSPFIEMEGGYSVHVRDDASGVRIAINERRDGEPLLSTSLVLRRRPLTDRMLLRMLVRYPFVTHKTIGLIHWHALRLWLRGAKFIRHGSARREHAGEAAS